VNQSDQGRLGSKSSRSGDAADYVPGPGDSWLTRKLHGFYVWRRNLKTHPLWGTVFVLAIALAGFGASIAWQWYQQKTAEPDKLLVEIKAKQDAEFLALREALDKLTNGEQGGIREVRAAVQAIQSTNQTLIDQLSLSREEYGRIRQVAEQRGVQGGYDVILTEETGMRIDSQNILGVTAVGRNGARVTLTSGKSRPVTELLTSGESIPYRSAEGRDCSVSLLSISEAGTAASFALMCG
jgi:hypothetical protein